MTRPVYLIQPPASFTNERPCLDDKQFGLGLLALAAWLKANGFHPQAIHAPLARLSGATIEKLVAEIIADDPLLVAIALNWVHFSNGAIDLSRKLKATAPQIPVVLGGQHASLFYEDILRLHGSVVDGVIVGEAELPLLHLCRTLAAGEIPSDIAGLAVPGAAWTRPNVVRDIDALPFYSYRAMRQQPLQPDVAALSTVRGACPYQCAWCIEPVIGKAQGRTKLQFHSADYVAGQICTLMNEGISRFTIQDNFFVGGDAKLTELAGAIGRRNLRPQHLNIFAHPESFTYAGLRAISDMCDRTSVDYGVETGCARVATFNHRRFDSERVVEAIVDAVNAGVEPYTWWMVGLPGEDDESLAATERLIERTMRVGGIPRWVSPLILFPLTPVHANPETYGVDVRFRGFEDYAQFSEITLAEALLFSDATTHSLHGASDNHSTAASLRLRQFIMDHMHLLETFYGAMRPPDFTNIRSTIAQSFF